jgi:hypothetical protein
MSKLPKAIKIVAINLIILVVLCELVSITTYYVWTRDFFYTRSADRVDSTLTVPETVNRGGGQQEMVQQLHPYFGFIDKAGLNHKFPYSQTSHVANNLGFASNYPYPFKKQNSNQFVVGVFGGSVAANYAFFEIEQQILATALKKLPELSGKEIIILPFAIGGYKQPQQLLVLSYFLSIGQEFDLVINIDGFNEVALAYLNYQRGSDLSTPSDFIFLPMVNLATGNLSREELALTLEVIKKKERQADSVKSLNSARTATGYVLGWLWARYATRSYREEVVRLDQAHAGKGPSEQSYMQMPAGKKLTESEALEAMVALWSRSSLMMKQLLDRKKTPYFHFVQPNQYVQTSRVMSREERAVAFNEASPFRPGAVKGYPLMTAELDKLQQAGLNVFSAVNVFDTISEPVYMDDCCHYNQAGNVAFCNYVATTVTQTMSNESRLKQLLPPAK